MQFNHSVIRVPLVITPRASEEDRATFICRSELLLVIENFFIPALLTWLLDSSFSLHIGFCHFLKI
jgi:hypothetical protein